MTKRRIQILADEEGSVMVEMVFFLPIVILIWILLNFIHQAKYTAEVTQRQARDCAWQYALNECGSMPPECSAGGTTPMPDGELRGAGNWAGLQSGVAETSANLTPSLHGRLFEVTSEESVTRPSILGGSTTAQGRHGTMCGDDPRIRWEEMMFWQIICPRYGRGEWCN